MQGMSAARCATEARKSNAAEVLKSCVLKGSPTIRRAPHNNRPRQADPIQAAPPASNAAIAGKNPNNHLALQSPVALFDSVVQTTPEQARSQKNCCLRN